MSQVNIINAILNVVKQSSFTLSTPRNTRNRAQAVGESLENYVKDIFASTLNEKESVKLQHQNKCFSYGGGVNNPPDIMIRGGAAIEIKKVQSIGSIPLNSSFPKSKLHRDDSRISRECREAEGDTWTEKDMIYAIGNVKDNSLKSLALVYGDVYCANREYYEKIIEVIKESLTATQLHLEDESNELAHINAVDPLGITYLRARGMWGIKHPFKVFDYIYSPDNNHSFELMAIVPSAIFNTFENKEDLIKEIENNPYLMIDDRQVKDPNNTVNLIDVKLITFFKE